MPSSEPICAQALLDAYQTLLELQRDSSGTYYYRPKAVLLEPRNGRDCEDYPTYCLFPNRFLVPERLTTKRYTVGFQFTVLAWGTGADDEERTLVQLRMARDIVRALDALPHRSAVGELPETWDTILTGVRFTTLVQHSIVGVVLDYKCPYRFKDGAL